MTDREYAWGHDDLSPVSESYSDSYGGWGATIVDALDTIVRRDAAIRSFLLNKSLVAYGARGLFRLSSGVLSQLNWHVQDIWEEALNFSSTVDYSTTSGGQIEQVRFWNVVRIALT